MTDHATAGEQYPDDIVERLVRAMLGVPDPDPGREFTACPDCRTPQVAITEAEAVGVVLAVAHDPTCPAFAAMTEDERYVMVDGGVIVHLVRSDREP